jgi:hypothetical protein
MSFRHALVLGIAAQLACTGAAAGVAFTPGTKPAEAPVAFPDTGHESPPGDRGQLTKATTKPAPTVGVSLVVNGKPFDAGSLPPPPIPVVVAP